MQRSEDQSSAASAAPVSELIWIHCNKCFELYINKKRKIFILSCQHIICENCVQKAEDKKVICSYCKKSTSYHLLRNDLPFNVKRFFNPRPWTNLDNISKVVPFQLKHRTNFLRGLLKAETKVKEYEKDNERLKMKCKEIFLKREKLHKLRLQYENEIKSIKKMSSDFGSAEAQQRTAQKKSIKTSCRTNSFDLLQNSKSNNYFSRSSSNDVDFIL